MGAKKRASSLMYYFLIEDILERAFQSRQLERQKPAIEFDYYELSEKWIGKNPKTN